MENEEIDLIEVMAKLWHRKRTIMYIALFFSGGWFGFSFLFTKEIYRSMYPGFGNGRPDNADQCRRNVAFSEYADGGYAEYAYCFAGYVSGYFFQCTFSERVDLFSFIHR